MDGCFAAPVLVWYLGGDVRANRLVATKIAMLPGLLLLRPSSDFSLFLSYLLARCGHGAATVCENSWFNACPCRARAPKPTVALALCDASSTKTRSPGEPRTVPADVAVSLYGRDSLSLSSPPVGLIFTKTELQTVFMRVWRKGAREIDLPCLPCWRLNIEGKMWYCTATRPLYVEIVSVPRR